MRKVATAHIFFILTICTPTLRAESYEGKYCELDGATTESGSGVTGECYMYSDVHGEIEGAETDEGESVSGECYRYSENYAELDGAETESGETVSGDCYFYDL